MGQQRQHVLRHQILALINAIIQAGDFGKEQRFAQTALIAVFEDLREHMDLDIELWHVRNVSERLRVINRDADRIEKILWRHAPRQVASSMVLGLRL